MTLQERIREMAHLYEAWDNMADEEKDQWTAACARQCTPGFNVTSPVPTRPEEPPKDR